MANQGGKRDPAISEETEGIAAKERKEGKKPDAFGISAAFSGKAKTRRTPCEVGFSLYLPSAFAASAIFTAELSMIESDGSRITASSVFRPDKTSTVLP